MASGKIGQTEKMAYFLVYCASNFALRGNRKTLPPGRCFTVLEEAFFLLQLSHVAQYITKVSSEQNGLSFKPTRCDST